MIRVRKVSKIGLAFSLIRGLAGRLPAYELFFGPRHMRRIPPRSMAKVQQEFSMVAKLRNRRRKEIMTEFHNRNWHSLGVGVRGEEGP